MRKLEKRKQILRVCGSVAGMLILAALVVLIASGMERPKAEETTETTTKEKEEAPRELLLWYYDSAYDSYMEKLCADYEKQEKIPVKAVRVTSDNYLEAINETNISGEGKPDLFLVGSEQVEKAYLAGLLETNGKDNVYTKEAFGDAAIAAITYNEKKVAYPFAFDTCFMVYNTSYVKKQPETFDDILKYAEGFDGEKYQKVRTILEWDVSDLMFNYGFVGSYIQCGGENGDDESVFDVMNKKLKQSLEYYKELQRFFSIDIEAVNYEKVKKDFEKGKIVYALVQLDCIKEMEGKVKLKACKFPELTKELETKTMSNTTVIGVNPYSEHPEEAGSLAVYMTTKNVEDVYRLTGGRMSAKKYRYADDNLNTVYECYEDSVGMPKLMSASEFRMKLKIALNNIWTGSKIDDVLKALNDEVGVNLDKKQEK